MLYNCSDSEAMILVEETQLNIKEKLKRDTKESEML